MVHLEQARPGREGGFPVRSREAVARAVSYGLEHREFSGVFSIGIDEISRRRGHPYTTNVCDLKARRLIWTGVGRDAGPHERHLDCRHGQEAP